MSTAKENPFGKSERSVDFYTSVAFGKLVISYGKKRPEMDIPDLIERTNKNGEKVYEVHQDYITGRIVSCEIKVDEEYGDKLMIMFNTRGTKTLVQVPFDSAYGRGFLNKMLNIDVSKDVRLAPYEFLDRSATATGDPKKDTKRGISIEQNGIKVAPLYTKENPNGLPELKQVTLNNKPVWDSGDQLRFYATELFKFQRALKENPVITSNEEPDTDFSEYTGDVVESVKSEVAPPITTANDPGEESDGLPF